MWGTASERRRIPMRWEREAGERVCKQGRRRTFLLSKTVTLKTMVEHM